MTTHRRTAAVVLIAAAMGLTACGSAHTAITHEGAKPPTTHGSSHSGLQFFGGSGGGRRSTPAAPGKTTHPTSPVVERCANTVFGGCASGGEPSPIPGPATTSALDTPPLPPAEAAALSRACGEARSIVEDLAPITSDPSAWTRFARTVASVAAHDPSPSVAVRELASAVAAVGASHHSALGRESARMAVGDALSALGVPCGGGA